MQRHCRTTKQMIAAPKDSVFVWLNCDLAYPRDLAKSLGREDLVIVPPQWLSDGWRGRELSGLVVDHSLRLDWRQRFLLIEARGRVRHTCSG